MKKEILVYLDDMLESIENIQAYTKGISFEKFENDIEKQDSVIRRIGIIGEAVKNLPKEIKEKYPEIPWRQIAGTRDIVIHEYASVSLGRVWKIITDDLDPLKAMVEKIKANE